MTENATSLLKEVNSLWSVHNLRNWPEEKLLNAYREVAGMKPKIARSLEKISPMAERYNSQDRRHNWGMDFDIFRAHLQITTDTPVAMRSLAKKHGTSHIIANDRFGRFYRALTHQLSIEKHREDPLGLEVDYFGFIAYVNIVKELTRRNIPTPKTT